MNSLGSATPDSRKYNSCKNVTDIRCEVTKNPATTSNVSPIPSTTTGDKKVPAYTNVTNTTTAAKHTVITVTDSLKNLAPVIRSSVSSAPYEAITGLEVTSAINTVATTPAEANLNISKPE